MRQFRNMLYVTVSALFMATAVTPWEAEASSLTIPKTNNNSAEYQIAAMQFLPNAEDSELGFGGKTTSGDYNRGETLTKGCTEGTTAKCTGGQSVVRSYRAPNGQTCYVCGTSNAQKCLDKGFKKQEDWPKLDTISSNEKYKSENLFVSIFNNIFGVKSANAAIELVREQMENTLITDTGGTHINPDYTTSNSESLQKPMDPIDKINPIDPIYPIDPVRPFDPDTEIAKDGNWVFNTSSTCPEDPTYVKGVWKFVEAVKACLAVNCKDCVQGSSNVCITCNSGYSLNSGSCVAKTVENCRTYDSSRNCTACFIGYKLNSLGLCMEDSTDAQNPAVCKNTVCNGRTYCCPLGASCATMAAGGKACFTDRFEGGDLNIR